MSELERIALASSDGNHALNLRGIIDNIKELDDLGLPSRFAEKASANHCRIYGTKSR